MTCSNQSPCFSCPAGITGTHEHACPALAFLLLLVMMVIVVIFFFFKPGIRIIALSAALGSA